MCGIWGARGLGLSEDQGRAATRTLAHRGPDGEGVLRHAPSDTVLGHRRLAIIDLSEASAQPMLDVRGELALTFNGEIYNYRALRDELSSKGHRLRSEGDGEVLLALWREEGEAMLERLHGMFAFAIHDRRDDSLFVARDRLGIKPLVYWQDGGRLAFASELKALRATPGLPLVPDVTAAYDFLTYQFIPAPKTFYERVRKLPAAHCLRWKDGALSVRRWWSPPLEQRAGAGLEELTDELEALLGDVVEDHLVADVPVGVFLSGGIDSTLVAALASERHPERLSAYTIGFGGRKQDESGVAAATVRMLGLDGRAADFDVAEARERLPLGVTLYDEPFADHSFLPTLRVSELAVQERKVVLSGDGGDETHLGYGRYFKAQRRRAAHRVADLLPLSALVNATPLRRHPGLRSSAEGAMARTCHAYGGIPRDTKRLFLDGAERFRDYDDYWFYREHARADDGLSDLTRQQLVDLAGPLPDAILAKTDRASMHVGLEVRPPLLDHRLVEWAFRAPDALKAGEQPRKPLLVRLLERRGLGLAHGVAKKGFSVPMRAWVEEEGMFRLDGDLDVLGAFRIRAEDVERTFDPRRDHQRIWVLHCLERFLRQGP